MSWIISTVIVLGIIGVFYILYYYGTAVQYLNFKDMVWYDKVVTILYYLIVVSILLTILGGAIYIVHLGIYG